MRLFLEAAFARAAAFPPRAGRKPGSQVVVLYSMHRPALAVSKTDHAQAEVLGLTGPAAEFWTTCSSGQAGTLRGLWGHAAL